MKEVLQDLNRTKGVIGSMIVSGDGIVVLSSLPTDLDKEFTAALIASVVEATSKAMSGIVNEELDMITIEAENNIVIVENTKIGFLVVVGKSNSNLGLIRVECRRAQVAISKF